MRRSFALAVLVTCLLVVACVKSEIHDADRPLLVTVDDLKQFGFEFGPLADRQVFHRTWHFDGSLEIEYEFDTPEDSDDSLYLSVTAGFERSVRDAVATYRMEKGGTGIGARLGGVEMREEQGFFQWGDESFFASLVGENGPGGNVFAARLKNKTYWVMIAGLYFDDTNEWARFIQPKLDYLATYDPT